MVVSQCAGKMAQESLVCGQDDASESDGMVLGAMVHGEMVLSAWNKTVRARSVRRQNDVRKA